jgi:hypothetical protein
MAQLIIGFSDRLQDIVRPELVREAKDWWRRTGAREEALTVWRDNLATKLNYYG